MLDRKVLELKEQAGSGKEVSENLIHLKNKNNIMRQANRVILNQQMAVIEEQRLNVLFQMLGITLHELNQPLTSLLGNIELMILNQDNPERLKENIKRVEDAGKRFSQIIRKIQNIRQGKTLIQDHLFCPMKTNKQLKFLSLVSEKQVMEKIKSIVEEIKKADLFVFEINPGNSDDVSDIDLVIVDENYLTASKMNIIRHIKNQNNELPILAVLNPNNEKIAFDLIQNGVDEYCSTSELNTDTLIRVINHVSEKARISHQLNSALKDLAGISIQDEQTGLFQRKFFRDALEREITKAKRKDISCVICKMDINDFIAEIASKGQNGQKNILKDTSTMLQHVLGESHLVCRYGNESFAYILSSTSTQEAQHICETLQEKLESFFISTYDLKNSSKIFIGMTQFHPENLCSVQELVESIDKATSQARDMGQSPKFISVN